MSLLLAWTLLISGCCLLPNREAEEQPFICDVQPAYDATGKDDTTAYRVNRACLRGIAARLKAAYKE
jgi:hypothetical protein